MPERVDFNCNVGINPDTIHLVASFITGPLTRLIRNHEEHMSQLFSDVSAKIDVLSAAVDAEVAEGQTVAAQVKGLKAQVEALTAQIASLPIDDPAAVAALLARIDTLATTINSVVPPDVPPAVPPA